jgi:hypothetical protein
MPGKTGSMLTSPEPPAPLGAGGGSGGGSRTMPSLLVLDWSGWSKVPPSVAPQLVSSPQATRVNGDWRR